MLYKLKENKLESIAFEDFGSIGRKEKELENIFAQNLEMIYGEYGVLFPVFQERPGQEAPDLCALDKEGNLIIFEFKRSEAPESTTNQIMRYAEIYGQKSYDDLNSIYKKYISKKNGQDNMELVDAHREAFALKEPLKLEYFNHEQKMIIVGSSMDHKLAKTVDYWKSKGVSIDFIPYRLFEIQGEYYLEYFAKPYDYVLNVGNVRGILFDTNLSYDTDAIWDMFKGNKISAYDERSRCVGYFNKNDYVFYYHKGYGVVAAGKICDNKPHTNKGEAYRKVEFLTPKPECKKDLRGIAPSELSRLLGKGFYYASTVKRPYLDKEESERLVDKLKEKYQST